MKKGICSVFFDIINVVFFALFSLTIIYPFWDMIVVSLSPAKDVVGLGFRLWPENFQLDAYIFAFRNPQILDAYVVTVSRAILGTLFSLLLNACIAYTLSKKELPFRNSLTVFILIPMFFSGGLIPYFLLLRDLGLYNNFLVYILPGAVSSFNIILLRNYFQNMDRALEEAAKIDGANYMRVLFQIVIPLAKPILATLVLWSLVAHWNAWFDSMVFVTDKSLNTLSFVLRRLLIDDRELGAEIVSSFRETGRQFLTRNLQAAITIIIVFPILCTYPFLQKYFVKGIMIGALKG